MALPSLWGGLPPIGRRSRVTLSRRILLSPLKVNILAIGFHSLPQFLSLQPSSPARCCCFPSDPAPSESCTRNFSLLKTIPFSIIRERRWLWPAPFRFRAPGIGGPERRNQS